VLSDDDNRAAYDRWGAPNPDMNSTTDIGIPDFDPFVFYAVLFNSYAVEPYIGDLSVASFTSHVVHLMRAGGGTLHVPPEDYMKLLWGGSDHGRRKRQLEIAIHLKSKVTGYVNGIESKAEFRSKCKVEALSIANSPFGPQYLTAIGRSLVLESSQFLGFQRSALGWFTGLALLMKKNAIKVKSMLTIIRETMDVLRLLPEKTKFDENGKVVLDARSDAERMEEILPELLDVAWAYNYQDIAKTLHGACSRLFADASANSKYKRMERAEAVQMMGEEFLLVAFDGHIKAMDQDERKNIMMRLEVAMQAAQMKVRPLVRPAIRK
jgi:X-domain of DnaJ-containing